MQLVVVARIEHVGTPREIASAAAGHDPCRGVRDRAVEERDRREVEFASHDRTRSPCARGGRAVRIPSRRYNRSLRPPRASRAPMSLRRVIESTAPAASASVATSALIAVVSTPMPSGLVRIRSCPGRRPVLVRIRSGIHLAGHRQAVLRFGVVDRVSANDRESGSGRDVLAASQQFTEELGRKLVGVPPDEIEGEQRPTPHCVDVGHAVCSGDPTPGPGVVDDRRDEVGRRDQCPVRVELPHGGIVAGVGTHEQFSGVVGLQMAHDVRQLARGELAASTGPVAELCEANPIAFTHVRTLPTGPPGRNGSRIACRNADRD